MTQAQITHEAAKLRLMRAKAVLVDATSSEEHITDEVVRHLQVAVAFWESEVKRIDPNDIYVRISEVMGDYADAKRRQRGYPVEASA